MNKELVNNLRLDSGIARLADWDNALICVNREGNVIDPLEGIEILVKAVVEECLDILDDENGDIDYCKYLIRNKFGLRLV